MTSAAGSGGTDVVASVGVAVGTGVVAAVGTSVGTEIVALVVDLALVVVSRERKARSLPASRKPSTRQPTIMPPIQIRAGMTPSAR